MSIPKPKQCGQDWGKMIPVDGGRICQACEKRVVDFSELKWPEIEKIQRESDLSTCGKYSQKQLEYWGQTPPTIKTSINKTLFASLAAVLVGVSWPVKVDAQSEKVEQRENSNSTIAHQQGELKADESFLFTGRVVDENTNEAIPFATVKLLHTNITASTNFDGFFTFKIAKSKQRKVAKDSLSIHSIGYQSTYLDLKEFSFSDSLNIQLPSTPMRGPIYFSVVETKKVSKTKKFFTRVWYGLQFWRK